jgi:hypothetical protein
MIMLPVIAPASDLKISVQLGRVEEIAAIRKFPLFKIVEERLWDHFQKPFSDYAAQVCKQNRNNILLFSSGACLSQYLR